MNATSLATRDMALAAFMGTIAGGDFGNDAAFAAQSPFDMTAYSCGQDQRSASPYGADFGDFGYGGFGVDAPPPPPMSPGIPTVAPPHQPSAEMQRHGGYGGHPHAPHPAEVARVWHEHHARLQHDHVMHQHRMSRELLLDPNKFSSLKVERYSFTLNSPVQTFGSTDSPIDATLQPAVKMRPDRLVTNVLTPFFVELTTIQVSNVNILVGGPEDAYIYIPQAQNVVLQLPTIEPAFRVTMTGDYSGQTPTAFSAEGAFVFKLSFQGWAVLAGNG